MGLLMVGGVAACGPAFLPGGPPIDRPHFDRAVIVARDGARLPAYHWQPEGRPRAIVIALHSFGDYGRGFASLGRDLAIRGYALVAIDQRGFGGAGRFGRWSSIDTMVDDLLDTIATVRAADPDVPLHLLGESMGGGVALVAAARHRLPEIDTIILTSPGVRGGVRFRYLYNLVYGFGAYVLPGLSTGITPQQPGYTVEAHDRFASDPLVLRRVRVDTYYGLLRLTDAASDEASRVRKPVFMMVGGADDYVPRVSTCRLARDLPNLRRVLVVEGGMHRFLHQQDMGTQANAAIIDWLDGDEPPIAADAAAELCGDQVAPTIARAAVPAQP